MKDIPIFDTPHGVASLILKDIPYRGEAYIRVQAAQPDTLEALIRESRDFCRMAGAERIYATAEKGLEAYPIHCEVLKMCGPGDFQAEGRLQRVTEQTVAQWREICNRRMADVDNSVYKSAAFDKTILSSNCYFVYDEAELLGIGWVEEGELLCVASVKRGAGARTVRSLLSAQSAKRVNLEVVSTNHRAIALYQHLGFEFVGVRSVWYRV